MSVGFEISVPLGDDSDCETCGYTYNDLRVSVELGDGGVVTSLSGSTSIGCFGGDNFSDESEVFAGLDAYSESFSDAADDLRVVEAFLERMVAAPQ